MAFVHKACDIVVFDNESQIDLCANSSGYKNYNTAIYGFFGFILSLFLISLTIPRSGNMIAFNSGHMLMILCLTIAAGAYGYKTADKAAVKAEYDKDQAELNLRQATYPDRASNVRDLINFRKLVELRSNRNMSGRRGTTIIL